MQFNGWYMAGLLYLRWKRYNGILCRKSRKQAGQSFKLNTPLVVDETALPALTAVPVKKSGVDLPEANFEAWATLQVDYQ